MLLYFPCAIIACTYSHNRHEQKRESPDSTAYNNPVELSQEQQSAFDYPYNIDVLSPRTTE